MNEDYIPPVWIGCLNCYNNGSLVGDWHDAADAADVTPEDVHGRKVSSSHDELWCFDHENIPTDGELDPMAAGEWGERYEEVTGKGYGWDAFMAYVGLGGHGHGVPDFDHFEDSYVGEYGTMRAYAEEYLEETGDLSGLSDLVRSNIDYDGVAEDLSMDHTEQDGHIFRQV